MKYKIPSLKPLRYIITPAGVGIAVICFFLPWIEVSCGPINVSASGARIGGTLWLSFAATLAVLISFLFFFVKQNLRSYCRLTAIFFSLGALAALVYKLVGSLPRSEVRPTSSQIISMIQIPFYGEILGLILIIVGAFIFPVGHQKKTPETPPESKEE